MGHLNEIARERGVNWGILALESAGGGVYEAGGVRGEKQWVCKDDASRE